MRSIAILLALFALTASGCAVEELVVAEETELDVALTSADEAMLLDVGIVEFDAGIPKKNNPEKTGVYEDIRRAEEKLK